MRRDHSAASLTGAAPKDSTGTPVSRVIARANRRDGVALPDFTFVIIERSHPTFAASAASVIPHSFIWSAKVVMARNVNVMNVNVKHIGE